MGRKKKDDAVSYIHIVSSTYVKQKDYEKAQITFSNALDDYGNVKKTSEWAFLDIETEDHWGDDEIYD